jgi:hypothetical protein
VDPTDGSTLRNIAFQLPNIPNARIDNSAFWWVYTYMHMNIYMHVCEYFCTFKYMCTVFIHYKHVYMYIYVYVYVCICIYAYLYKHAHFGIYIGTCFYIP